MSVTIADEYDVLVIYNFSVFFGEVRSNGELLFQTGNYGYAFDAWTIANDWMISTTNELIES